jgi:hypothetical protein
MVPEERSRRGPELNRCTGICSPLPNHSATPPWRRVRRAKPTVYWASETAYPPWGDTGLSCSYSGGPVPAVTENSSIEALGKSDPDVHVVRDVDGRGWAFDRSAGRCNVLVTDGRVANAAELPRRVLDSNAARVAREQAETPGEEVGDRSRRGPEAMFV